MVDTIPLLKHSLKTLTKRCTRVNCTIYKRITTVKMRLGRVTNREDEEIIATKRSFCNITSPPRSDGLIDV